MTHSGSARPCKLFSASLSSPTGGHWDHTLRLQHHLPSFGLDLIFRLRSRYLSPELPCNTFWQLLQGWGKFRQESSCHAPEISEADREILCKWQWEPSGLQRRTPDQQVVFYQNSFPTLNFWLCLFVIPHYLYSVTSMHSTEWRFRFACWNKLRLLACGIFLGVKDELNKWKGMQGF